jgi:hypothetical protein
MGLRMSRQEINRTLLIVHGALALALPFLIAFLIGCMKLPKSKPADLGPQASEEDMEFAISKALYGINPCNSALRQQVIYDVNRRIENSEDVQALDRSFETYLSRELVTEPEAMLKLVLRRDFYDLVNMKWADKVDSDPMEYAVDCQADVAAASRAAAAGANSVPTDLLKAMLKSSEEDGGVVRKTYHNLKTEAGVMDPPNAVKAKPECGGVPGCQLRFFRMQYDEVSWFSDSRFVVARWLLTTSRDAPFVGFIQERCLGRMVTAGGRSYYVRDCQYARDFTYRDAELPDRTQPPAD